MHTGSTPVFGTTSQCGKRPLDANASRGCFVENESLRESLEKRESSRPLAVAQPLTKTGNCAGFVLIQRMGVNGGGDRR